MQVNDVWTVGDWEDIETSLLEEIRSNEMAQRVNFKCYKCKTYSLTKQGLVRHAGHLYCRPCARSLQEGQQQLPQRVKVGRRFQTMLDRLLLEK